MSAREDVSALLALQVRAESVKGGPGDDAGALLAALAVHHVEIAAGAVYVLYLQGSNLRDAKAAAGHEPEEGSLSQGGGCGKEAVPLLKGEEVFGVHAMGEDVIILLFYDIDGSNGCVFVMGRDFSWPAKCCFYLAI